MIDHVSLKVRDFKTSLRFFTEALAPLGYKVVMEFPNVAGLGVGGKPDFWIGTGEPSATSVHLAFSSRDRGGVNAFHAAALKAGGRDNGAPGIRAHYHANYYGAFVHDPDGNNIEAVCHVPQG